MTTARAQEKSLAEQRMSSQTRRERMAVARAIATHTHEEWLELAAEFGGRCVRCGSSEYNVERDHILPVYQGGSDGIENIQPLCARCNAAKGPESFNWAAHRRLQGFE